MSFERFQVTPDSKGSNFFVLKDDVKRNEEAEEGQDGRVDEHEAVEPVEKRSRDRQQDGRGDESEDL